MGNNLLTTQVGSTGTTSTTYPNPYTSTSQIGSTGMYGNNMFNLPNYGKDYSNDMMMPDYLKTNYANTGYSTANPSGSVFGTTQPTQQQYLQQPQQTPQVSQQPAFSGSQEQLEQYYNMLNQNAETQQQAEKPSGSLKKTGLIAGILVPIATGICKVAKGKASASKVFGLKSLAVKVPLFALAGWCAGALIDNLTGGSKKQNTQQIGTAA